MVSVVAVVAVLNIPAVLGLAVVAQETLGQMDHLRELAEPLVQILALVVEENRQMVQMGLLLLYQKSH